METLELRQMQTIRQESFHPILPGVELTIDIESGVITGSERFFSTYSINNIHSWMQAVFDEDRETVQQVLLHGAIEPPHSLYYRLKVFAQCYQITAQLKHLFTETPPIHEHHH